MAYPIQFNNKYKIQHFVIRHFIVSAVKLKNAEFDSIGSYLFENNFFILKMAYPMQFNNKYKIQHFMIRHLIVSVVKLKNAKNDVGLCPGVARCSLRSQTFAHPFSFQLLVIARN